MTKYTKSRLVQNILRNPIYLPESGLYLGLQETLMKLSVSQLWNLKTLIDCKVSPVVLRRPDGSVI